MLSTLLAVVGPYLLWIKLGLLALALATVSYTTHRIDADHYEGIAAKDRVSRQQAVVVAMVTRDEAIRKQREIERTANEERRKNDDIMEHSRSELAKLRLTADRASHSAKLARTALHAAAGASSGVLPGPSTESVSEQDQCDETIKDSLWQADQQNNLIIETNAKMKEPPAVLP